MRLIDRLPLLLMIASLLGCAADATGSDDGVESAQSALRESDLTLDLTLRATSPVQIHAHVWSGGAQSGATVLAVHGATEAGAVFGPLARAILEDRTLRRRVRRVIAIDLPGHGQSAFPDPANGLRFGDLAIEDYVGVVIDSLRGLRRQGIAPSVLIGHSLGGLEVQAAQETLLAQGSSLARLGIRRALLLAPVPPHGQPWTLPMMMGDGSSLLVQDPVHGIYLQLTPELFVAGIFGRLDGTIAANAPTPQQAADAGYGAPEPLSVVLQMVEQPMQLPDGSMLATARPSVRAGAFPLRGATPLELASFSQDGTATPADLATLYPYLTGDDRGRLYDAINDDDATHGMFISDPDIVLDALHWP